MGVCEFVHIWIKDYAQTELMNFNQALNPHMRLENHSVTDVI